MPKKNNPPIYWIVEQNRSYESHPLIHKVATFLYRDDAVEIANETYFHDKPNGVVRPAEHPFGKVFLSAQEYRDHLKKQRKEFEEKKFNEELDRINTGRTARAMQSRGLLVLMTPEELREIHKQREIRAEEDRKKETGVRRIKEMERRLKNYQSHLETARAKAEELEDAIGELKKAIAEKNRELMVRDS